MSDVPATPEYDPGAPRAARTGVIGGGSMAARVILTILGAAGMIVGAFLAWLKRGSGSTAAQAKAAFQSSSLNSLRGTRLSAKAFFSTKLHPGHFLKSAGFVLIVLGLIALIGLAFRTGWLTRIAGVLGVVAIALYGIEIVRSPQQKIANIGIGTWLALIGSIIAFVGGFFGSRPKADVEI
jgi:hypothetical protein